MYPLIRSGFLWLCLTACMAGKGYAQAPRKKILIVATSTDYLPGKERNHSWGCYTPEVVCFAGVLLGHGYTMDDIDVVSPKGGAVPLAVPVSYPRKYAFGDSARQQLEWKLQHSLRPAEVQADRYQVVYYSGGFSALVDYPVAEDIGALAGAVYEAGGIVAAVCDGVSGLVAAKTGDGAYLVRGKQVALNVRDRQIGRQLTGQGALMSKDPIITDQRLITARGVKPAMVAAAVWDLLSRMP